MRRRFVWRSAAGPREILVAVDSPRRVRLVLDGESFELDCARLPDGRRSVLLPSGRQLAGTAAEGEEGSVIARIGARALALPLVEPLRELAGAGARRDSRGPSEIRAQIPGRVVEVRVRPGDLVEPSTPLLVLEAMKMQNDIRAEFSARVVELACSAGQTVEAGALLLRLAPAE